MRKRAACLGHLLLLATAYGFSHSTSGFLLAGPGVALLLDRYFLRLLPWPGSLRWRRELRLRAVSAVVGAGAVLLARPRLIPLNEAIFWGLVVSVFAFWMETATRLLQEAPRRLRFAFPVVITGMIVLLVPLYALHPLHTVPRRTPAAMGFAFEEVAFDTADGLQLSGWLVPHPRSQGNVLFCHGHGRNRGHVAGLLRTLHELRLNVLTFDFRGHGRSPGHTATFGHREVQDVLAAAAYLRRRCPGQPLFLVGVSYGAAVALQALPLLPEVRGVWSEGCFDRFSHVVDHYFSPIPAGLRKPLIAGYDALASLDSGFRSAEINPQAALAGMRVPIYFCHAQGDTLIPLSEALSLYETYQGPKDFYWVEGATHHNARQRGRGEYLRRLRTFLADRLNEERQPGHTDPE